MTDFTGIHCPVCGKPFLQNDDVVVCPECGAPYHRACYQKVGHCIYQDKHGTSASWHAPEKEADPAQGSVRCPRCGHDNPAHLLLCEHCGTPLHQQSAAPNSGPGQPGGMGSPFPGGSFPNPFPGGQIPFVFDPMAGVDPEATIDGVKAGELCKVVQSNTTYYLPVFLAHERLHKNRFNFGAFLLGGGWLLYRKVYRIGSILTAAALLLEVISQFLSVRFSNPILLQILNQLSISNTSSLTMQQYRQIAEQVMQLSPNQQALFFLPSLLPLIVLVLHIVIGCVGNNLYRRHCVKTVRKVQSACTNDSEMLIYYQERGGVNTMLLIVVFICYFIVSNASFLML